ncbi:NAD(P)H-dependent glycerol-3-phosphate dehydrogenase [Corynebacterium uterequi]|uniref:Glycerol-3-phosphate dehydrogenase [NAD(P)+] n=1 Tax=Corynebacterium uterequi TaxID=1072256 RepID=A0A0G3HII5_9CORY|nr:NAD(P)H-dependent glycerol-3-phosphate dehydrogenase [Corynebacterium uterequi]AKK10972.1 glycerol-3-phosphate dehydrogenase [Corynebacterium uterequi]
MVNVAVMGAGSWGTTLAKVFADAGNSVSLWARRDDLADTITHTHENPRYLPGIALPAALRASTDTAAVLGDADIVVLAVPSQTVRDNLASWRSQIPAEATIVSIAKGVEKATLLRMSQVIEEVTGVGAERIVVLSGPNLAREIAAEQPAATVMACVDVERARCVQHAAATSYLRPYTNTDVVGVELGGACKNVIALACGMASGMGLGDNTLASVITRGLAEITRLGVALGADPRTFAGLAGLGDLVATCMSPLSRNRSFGARLGAGASLKEAAQATNGQVAEGVISSKSIALLAAEHGVDMPITREVVAVCHEGVGVDEAIARLMGRTKKAE